MNLAEFKAWFAGYTENMGDRPTREQWARIKERMEEIDDRPAAPEVIIREVQRWRPYPWGNEPPYVRSPIISGGSSTGDPMPERGHVWCDIGRAEYAA